MKSFMEMSMEGVREKRVTSVKNFYAGDKGIHEEKVSWVEEPQNDRARLSKPFQDPMCLGEWLISVTHQELGRVRACHEKLLWGPWKESAV